MITIEEFKTRCITQSVEEIVDEIILANGALHVSENNVSHMQGSLARAYGISSDDIALRIVGSAKLGFSITEKKKTGVHYPRYRLFSPESDIDTAVVSPRLYRIIWEELSIYSHSQVWFPWKSGRLGDYMLCGWLRPDYFPKGIRLRSCDLWWDQFRRFSGDLRFERRSVRGGLFNSMEDLERYSQRSVKECVILEREIL